MNNLDLERKSLPNEPGIYQFKDENGIIIYIGKAISLKKRVAQYFNKTSFNDPYYGEKIKDLVSKIYSIDFIVTENEKEALILENILIKKHRPPFNVLMRDSKTYPWVMITYSEEFPRVLIIRNPHHFNQKNRFLGPYTDKGDILRILRDLRKIFPFCSCKNKIKQRKRHCLYYQLNLCPGPCIGTISKEDYFENIKKIELFLDGKTTDLRKQIRNNMENAAKSQRYEAAAFWRDKLDAIENSTIKQHVILYEEQNKDIVQYYSEKHFFSLIIIHIREGKIMKKSQFNINLKDKIIIKNELLVSLLCQYYQDLSYNIPDIIIIPQFSDNFILLNDILKNKKENIKIRAPIDYNEQALLKIAFKNAKVMVIQQIQMEEIKQKEGLDQEKILEEIKNLLDLPTIPRIIEGFDISNIEGKDATGSMVYFLEGRPFNQKYRHYKIKSKSTPDDVAMMKEVIKRRYSSIMKRNGVLPDLILIDGGKGQLNAAGKIIEDLGLEIPIISLAKRLEEIFILNQKESIILPNNSSILRLFQHIRDEAHRFAVRLHKKQREKRISKSILENIKGIGPAKRNMLFNKFGSIEGIKKASFQDISEIVGKNLAQKILEILK